ncbi:GDP-L-fucose synthase family protein [Paramagnetospirillum magneticum]|uniref:GDP-L-fucose synthase family protein n=1 Tax=Paramagnetospirillum magneticum TaxID=84159 RepID=UPI000313F343|nr:GDP-L-fucose synthase [Paramagnetospirillum magneticum]
MAGANFSLAGKRVFVAGHRGMAGSAILRRLQSEDCETLTVDRLALDLRNQSAVEAWMEDKRPDAVFLAAALVGGIRANSTRPAEFLYDNLAVEMNVIHAAHRVGVSRLLFLGSSCAYPREAAQPMAESSMLTGPLEPTNEAYAIAKIAGIKLCEAYHRQYGRHFMSAVPASLIGPGDRFDAENGHVGAALVMKFHDAVQRGADTVELWGTGSPIREFLYVDDLADACVFLMKSLGGGEIINVGSGIEASIRELAELTARVVGFKGKLSFDTTKPDGMMRKLVDSTRIRAMGWQAATSLEESIRRGYEWYLANSKA